MVSPVVGQRVYPSGQTNSNTGRRNHNATIRSADSADGSRVSITGDQSLADYEAYRRGERFYVKIPASEVPRAEGVRGRGFGDVTAQRSGDSTTLSFRLQPGASAHVEQRGNKLDVVILAAGSSSTPAANRPRDFRWSDASASVGSRNANTRGAAPNRGNNAAANAAGTNANKRGNQPSSGNKNSSTAHDNTSLSSGNSNSKAKPGNTNSSAAANKNGNANTVANSAPNSNSNSKPGSGAAGDANSSAGSLTNTAGPGASPSNSFSGSTNSSSPKTSAPTSATPVNSASPAATGQPGSGSDFWARAKERGRYWLQFAQLNPIPVAIGAAILFLIIALLFMQRRRARATRRARTVTKSKSNAVETAALTSVDPAPAAAVVAPAPATSADEVSETRVAAVPPLASENGRRERTSPAAEEANKIFAGQTYDESVVGSDNPETRRLVGAELLSAMVGRNSERRDRARAAFMKHGYFDDATRDLRAGTSENERAAAARRLSFVQDPEATPHLVGALNDPSPDVRRAAVEALMDQRDATAIAPLNALLQNETDRKVPRHLIEQAIEACATNSAQRSIPTPAVPSAPPPAIEDREVIEI